MRKEHDFLGELEVADELYYGVQTIRALENFHITGKHIDPDFIKSLAMVKKAAAMANMKTGRLNVSIGKAIVDAADDVIAGKLADQFPVDPIQGGAGTSLNMNMNEVLANRGLEIMGHPKGSYDIINPNNHVNMAQSTNDAFPTAIKVVPVEDVLTIKESPVPKSIVSTVSSTPELNDPGKNALAVRLGK